MCTRARKSRSMLWSQSSATLINRPRHWRGEEEEKGEEKGGDIFEIIYFLIILYFEIKLYIRIILNFRIKLNYKLKWINSKIRKN